MRSKYTALCLLLSLGRDGWAADTTLPRGVIDRVCLKESLDNHPFIYALAVSPDGRTIACGKWTGLYLWVPGAKQPARRFLPADKKAFIDVRALRFVDGGKRLISGSGDGKLGTLRHWDTATGKELNRVGFAAFLTSHVVLDREAKTLAIGTHAYSAHLLDPKTGERRCEPGAHEEFLYGLALSDDGRLLASTSRAGDLRLWNAATGKEHVRLAGAEEAHVPCLSPDGRLLAGWLPEQRLCIWSTASGQPVRHIRVAKPFVCSAFSPDGRVIAVGGKGLIQLFEVGSGKERLRLPTGKHVTWCLAFSPDSRRLAVGDSDATVWLYDLRSR